MEESYEGDYRCSACEGYDASDHCRKVATHVRREPYTPAGFRVLFCDEHANKTYSLDVEATAKLLADIAREKELEAV